MTAKEILDAYWNGDLPVPLISVANAMGMRVFSDPALDCSGKPRPSGRGAVTRQALDA